MYSPQEFQITCVIKPNRYSPHEHITHLGDHTGCLKREEVIRRIDTNEARFFTLNPFTGQKNYIYVVRGDGNKAPYVRTHSNGTPNDNLLSLAECGDQCRVLG